MHFLVWDSRGIWHCSAPIVHLLPRNHLKYRMFVEYRRYWIDDSFAFYYSQESNKYHRYLIG